MCVCMCVGGQRTGLVTVGSLAEHPRPEKREMCQRCTVADKRSATGSRSKFLAPAQPLLSLLFPSLSRIESSIKVTVSQLYSMKGRPKALASGGREGALAHSLPLVDCFSAAVSLRGGGGKEKNSSHVTAYAILAALLGIRTALPCTSNHSICCISVLHQG